MKTEDLVKEMQEARGFYKDPDDFEAWYDRNVSDTIAELLDIVDTHSCTLDVEGQSCICVEIGEELGSLGYLFPETKHVQLDEIPF